MEDVHQKSNKKDLEIDAFDFIDGKMSHVAFENLHRQFVKNNR